MRTSRVCIRRNPAAPRCALGPSCHRAIVSSRLRDCEPCSVDHGSRTPDRDRRRRSPRQLAAVADDAADRRDHRAAEGGAPGRGRPRGVVDDAPAADRARAPRGRAADRPRRGRQRPAGLGRRAAPTASSRRRPSGLRRRTASSPTPSRRSRRRRAGTWRCASGSAGRASVDALPDVMTGLAARPGVPEVDELGRVARRRQGRVPVRAAGALAAVPLRRPCGPVRHPAHRGRAVAAGAGRAVGRDDLRPPVPHHERPGRAAP